MASRGVEMECRGEKWGVEELKPVGGVFIGVGDENWDFLEFFSNFLELQRIVQRLRDVDESQLATSASRCHYRPARATDLTRQRYRPLPTRYRPALPTRAGANAVDSGSVAVGTDRCRRSLPPPTHPALPPRSRLSTDPTGSVAPATDATPASTGTSLMRNTHLPSRQLRF